MNLRRALGCAAFLFFMAQPAAVFSQTITNVSPAMGAFGDLINIYGNGFAPGNRTPTNLVVKFANNVVATTNPIAVVGDGIIQVREPTNCVTGYITVQINKGTIANSPSQFFVISTNAYVSSFSPLYGNANSTVTLIGVHFTTITNVMFNGVVSKTVTGLTPYIGQTNINVTAPDGVTTGPLVLMSSLGPSHDFSTANNQVTPSDTNFFVQPIITSFSPSSGRPGTNVTIQGTNFTGLTGVLFGGVGAVSFTIQNNNSLQAMVPTNASSGIITLNSPYTSPQFTTTSFRMQPTIYSFSPGSGPSGTLVTVNGAGLNEGSPNPTVTVGGGTVTSFGTVSPNTLSFNVPATASSGLITISTTNGSITSTQVFYLPPTISSFTPSGGGAGTMVRINGSNLTNATAVTFNGVPAAGFYVTNNSILGAVVPAGATSGTITVTTPGGSVTSSSLFYAPPTIVNFVPMHGSPGTNVTISGTSFTNATAVLFNGVPAASFTVTNDSLLGAVVPSGATTGPITVAAPGGTNNSTSAFIIDSADLGVTITGAPNPVFIGSNLVYTIVITNIGPVAASNVRLTNTLSQSVAVKTYTTSQGTLNTGVTPIYGALGTINNGNSATVTLTVAPSATGSITNTAVVASDLPDPNSANNTAFTTTTVWPLPLLSITNLMSNGLMQVSWPAPLSGFTLQFTTNLATNAWISDAGTKVVSGTNVSVTETNLGTARFFRLTN